MIDTCIKMKCIPIRDAKTGIQGYMPLYYDQKPNAQNSRTNVMYPIRYAMYRTTAGQARDHARTRYHVTRAQVYPNLATASLQVIIYRLYLFDIFDVAMSGENKTFIFLFVRIPKLSSLGVKRARAVN